MADDGTSDLQRELTPGEQEAMQQVRKVGRQVLYLLEQVRGIDDPDLRLLAIARTQLQLGFLALEQAIRKPEHGF